MYQIKINGETFDRIPSSIDDVSISRFLAFRAIDRNNDLALLTWALDCKPQFKHTEDVEKQLGKVFTLIDPVIKEIYAFMNVLNNKLIIPDSVDVLGCVVKLKGGLLNDLPYWPYVVAKSIIKQEAAKKPFDPTDRIPEILAHYLYSEVTKSPYDEVKAGEFVEIVNDIPMVPAIQLGNFFLLKLIDYFPSSAQSLVQTLKKLSKKQE